MEKISSDILRELECPVCMEYMLPPITMCENGHNICNKCKKILHMCPTCRQPFIDTRNMRLEYLTRDVQYPCINKNNGCNKVIFFDLIEKHQSECSFGTHKCPFTKVAKDKCQWEGFLSDMKNHVKSEHSSQTRKLKGKQTIFCTSYTFCQALIAFGDVFMYYSKVKDGIFYSCILYVGPKDKVKKYNYKIGITTTNRKENATMCLQSRSFLNDVADIFSSGNCALFHYNFVMNCTRVFKGLPVEVEISLIET